MPPPLFLLQNICLRLELLMRRYAPGLCENLPPLDLVLTRSPQQPPYVVPGLSVVQYLPEHLEARRHSLTRVPEPHYLYLVPRQYLPPLHSPPHYRSPARDREHVL